MSMAIVTPSHAPDLNRFRRLHESVIRHAPAGVQHYVLVPPPDVTRFAAVGTGRLTVLRQPDVVPAPLLTTTLLCRLPYLPRGYQVAAVNLRRPWPPIRGWVLQQLVKLAFVSTLEVDVALMVDSDVLLVRDFTEDVFRHGPSVRHHRVPHALHEGMPRHRNWRKVAARVLDLEAPSEDFADYNAGVVSWSPTIVRSLLARIEDVSGRDWPTVVAAELDVSEYFLYGEYVAAFGTPEQRAFTSERNLCHSTWETLTPADADRFVESVPPEDIALLVQSNSDTADEVLAGIAGHFLDT